MDKFTIGEGSFAPQRRKENQVASNALEKMGFTPATAAALLKTRNLSPGMFRLIMNALTGSELTPQRDTSKYSDTADS